MQNHILTFIIPIIALIFNVIFFAFWWTDKSRKYVLAYSVCYGSMAFGTVINIWILGSVGAFGIVSYHLFTMAGLLALMWGLAEKNDRKAPILASLATVGITCVVIWASIMAESLDAARQAQNTNAALILSIIAINLWHTASRHWSDRALIWVLVGIAAFGFVRPFLTMLSDFLFGAGEASAALLTSLHVLLLAVLLTLMALSLIATILYDDAKRKHSEGIVDPLSGLNMRGAFENAAQAMGMKAAKENVPVCLILADIDHFKDVNDNFGHVAGDKAITRFGQLISQTIRRGDISGRVGGEEFCILAWDCRTDAAVQLAERIRLSVARPDQGADDQAVNYTASFGVAEWRANESYTQLFERADKALYQAKNAGRNKVVHEGGVVAGQPAAVVPFVARKSEMAG